MQVVDLEVTGLGDEPVAQLVWADVGGSGFQQYPAGLAYQSVPGLEHEARTTSVAIPSARDKPVRTTTNAATAVPIHASRPLRMCW